MGGALLRGWLDSDIADRILVVEPDAAAACEFPTHKGLSFVHSVTGIDLDFRPNVVILAVKPQSMDAVLPQLKRFAGPETVFLSIAAGRTIASFERHLGPVPVLRSMPNTPASIGRGITVGCPNHHVSQNQIALCGRLLAAVGEVAWVDTESLIDAVTAVSGSGPAYVFLLIECLAKAGAEAGLSEELSLRLARATVAGAGELARRSPEPPAILRRNVTSPKGTTEAALNVLMGENGLDHLITAAVAAAIARAKELGS